MIYVDTEEMRFIKVRYMMLVKCKIVNCKLYISTYYGDELLYVDVDVEKYDHFNYSM